ncbi:hypothetical protein AX774_g6362 [Zancudomyces culisetae]|uniref:Uncharacterized protein n=1 Tax=Zancudomyces culisetae TaxID=1213189 RepID=A0A1R1PGV0_ZANCU|nr:hypothetical protein AX774_g6362 [Zancudomyces culisetae]|eukprot:OMH80204.1 hypothetical protein AX774_g6362 [Zancudomyces culisetae]
MLYLTQTRHFIAIVSINIEYLGLGILHIIQKGKNCNCSKELLTPKIKVGKYVNIFTHGAMPDVLVVVIIAV